MGLGGRDARMMLEVVEALGSSLDLHAMLKDAYRLLLPLVGADYGALAVSRSERADEYEWIVENLPPAFLASYEEMAPHDFVRSSVLPRPNVVLRDAEMIDRQALERNMMYRRAREVGSPLEHVMAVMLHGGGGFQSGLSLYRDRRRPFSKREQRILQRLTGPLAHAVGNCRTFAKVKRAGTLLDMLLSSKKRAVVVVQPPAREFERTEAATALLETWFTPVERGTGMLPRVLLDELAKARDQRTRGHMGPYVWDRPGAEKALKVTFRPLPEPVGDPFWALELLEVPHALPLLATWEASFTPTEREVALRLLRAWNNEMISQDLRCRPNTVKKHVQRIFEKAGVEDRITLMYLAFQAMVKA